MTTPAPILRLESDPGLLTNRRMTLEIGVGLAHLSGRRLSMPWDDLIGSAPGHRPATAGADGAPAVLPSVFDLWDVPVDVVSIEEWADVEQASTYDSIDWGPFMHCVYLADDDPVPHPGVRDFANGRTRYVRLPETDGPVSVAGRPLSFYSYFFHSTGQTRRDLLGTLERLTLKAPYRDLAQHIAGDLGDVNVAHVRRTDLVRGIRAYAGVSPERIAETLASVLPTDETLVIATEADSSSTLFDPIRRRFADVVFMSDVILGEHGEAFRSLPFSEDNALGAITQEVAARGCRFVGTMGSTFTSLIHRRRCQRDPDAPFLFTADYTPRGPTFVDGAYLDRRPGRYSWNRIAYGFGPAPLAWMREWPEAVRSADDEPTTPSDRLGDPPASVHAVVCTDTNPYGDWQCQLQEHTWHRVRQPGELVRLVATPNGEKVPSTTHARLVTTSARNDHPDAPGNYPGFNRLWSMLEWIDLERPTGSVLILDSDFVFRGPVLGHAAPGLVVVQQWYDRGAVAALQSRLAPFLGDAVGRLRPITWPLLIDVGDLRRILPRWIELTALLRRASELWESDMFGFAGAVAEAELDVRFENLGAWMNWPERFVAGAPIIHYCQEVTARDGSPMWNKRRYSPWEPLGLDPNDAALDYCRDFLHLLDDYVRLRNS